MTALLTRRLSYIGQKELTIHWARRTDERIPHILARYRRARTASPSVIELNHLGLAMSDERRPMPLFQTRQGSAETEPELESRKAGHLGLARLSSPRQGPRFRYLRPQFSCMGLFSRNSRSLPFLQERRSFFDSRPPPSIKVPFRFQ